MCGTGFIPMEIVFGKCIGALTKAIFMDARGRPVLSKKPTATKLLWG
jgi:hypothetical protein